MKKEKWYLMLSLVVIIISILSIVAILNRKNSEIKELQSQNDELVSQNFILQTDIGRYDMAIEIFKERNVSGGKQIEEILSKETE
jgi:hypothetical protein